MAILGTIAAGIYTLGFPWNLLVSGLIVWGTLKLTGPLVKGTMLTAAIAMLWNDFTPDRDYNVLDLTLNAAAAYFLLGVV